MDDHALTHALTAALATGPHPAAIRAVVDRRRHPLASTYETEIITCTVAQHRTLTLLCKYQVGDRSETWGHKRGLGYEADVYRGVLEPMGVSAPRFYGSSRDPATATTWLVIEYLPDVEYLDGPQLPQMGAWLGSFHRRALGRLPASVPLIHYDHEYYAGWARRSLEFCRAAEVLPQWLEPLCARFIEALGALLPEPTIIHGECYRKNVLTGSGGLHVVDWESCAVAAGEIDVAMLTEGWPAHVVHETEAAYREQRWSGATPRDFEQRLALARVYTQLRWLGETVKRTRGKAGSWRLGEAYTCGARAGLL